MTEPRQFDVSIIGGGIVGTATALALCSDPRISVVVLEKEAQLAAHQTGNNSGVIHSGLYYKPGSLKAKECVQGRNELYDFCERQNIPFERCGKVVVATLNQEFSTLEELERRGQANGLRGIRRLGPEQIRELEPHVHGIAGLFVPETGIVDFTSVVQAYARLVQEQGGHIQLNAEVKSVFQQSDGLILETHHDTIHSRHLINCGGLHCDRIARICGLDPGLRIVPFRGEYYTLSEHRRYLVNNLIYPIPDPRFPFLGVHFTRMISGGVEAGPNAVLALKREGYNRLSFSTRDMLSYLGYAGFWKMAGQYWKPGVLELWRSLSKQAFLKELRRLVPELEEEDLSRGGAGVRAQALLPNGTLCDDFRIIQTPRMIHVLNAPSPAATASLSIGHSIATIARKTFGLGS